MLKRLLLAIALLVGASAPAFANPTGCLPVTGVISGLQEQEDINAAIAVVLNNGRGATTPDIDCSGGPVEGEWFYNNSVAGYPALGIFDNTNFETVGILDRTNSIWQPTEGGGIGSLTAASTTDLGSVPQDRIAISGSTAINSFGSSLQPGQWKDLAFTSATPINYNAAAILTPSGANFTTTAGDRARAVYLGAGVWELSFYQCSLAVCPWQALPSNSVGTPQLSNNAVTNAKLAQASGNTLKGNNSGSTSNVSDLTPSQVLAMLFGSSSAGQNDVFAGPCSGGAGTPSFRALCSADIPSTNAIFLNNVISSPGTYADGSTQMIGSKFYFTPGYSGNVTLNASSYFSGTVSNMTFSIRYGTGTAPNNAAGSTGTVACAAREASAYTTGLYIPWEITCNITGLTIGTQYWMDLATAESTGSATWGPLIENVTEH